MSDPSLSDKVKSWLETQGYPLEMRVASEFRKSEFEVAQSFYYRDEDTGKARELDVFARAFDVRGYVNFMFAVECKSSKKPWLILSTNDTLSGNRLFTFAVSDDFTRKILVEKDYLSWLLENIPWFKKHDLRGYSVRQAFTDQQEIDVPFAAAISVFKAAHSLVAPDKQHHYDKLSFAFPVIVIDSPLFRCTLADDDSLTLEMISQGEFMFDVPGLQFGTIRIVTKDALPSFVREAADTIKVIRDLLKPEEQRLYEKHLSR